MEKMLHAKVSDRAAYLSLFLALAAFCGIFAVSLNAQRTAAELIVRAERQQTLRELQHAAAHHPSRLPRIHARDFWGGTGKSR